MGFGEIGEYGERAQRNEAKLSFDDRQGERAGKDRGVDGGKSVVGETGAGFDEGGGGEPSGRIYAGDVGERGEVARGGRRERVKSSLMVRRMRSHSIARR